MGMKATDAVLLPTRPTVRELDMAQLSDREFRYAWAFPKIRWAIAKQVYDMRTQRGWSRLGLARRAGISWITVMRVERSLSLSLSLRPLLKLANAFDCAFVCRFVAWSEFLAFIDALESGAWMPPPDFDAEDAATR